MDSVRSCQNISKDELRRKALGIPYPMMRPAGAKGYLARTLRSRYRRMEEIATRIVTLLCFLLTM